MSDQTHQKYPASVQHGKPRLTPLKEGWKRFSIGDLVEEVIRPVVMEDNQLYTLVTAKRSRGGIVKREDLRGRDIAVKNQFYVREGDFLISKRQIVHGACGFVPRELDGAIVSNEYLVLNCTNKIIPKYWELLSHSVYFQQICFHSSIGVHVEKMLFKVSRWYHWEINLPSIQEQEKIASFLGAVDTRLTQLRRRRELLQTYKRGVMQKLFSQKIRFTQPDGSPFPDWEKKKLGDLLTIRYGKDHQNLEEGEYPVLGTGGVMRYVNSYLYDKPSILIGRKGTIDQPQFVTYPFWTVDTLFYSEIHPEIFPFFLFLVVLSINWKKYNEATGVPSLNTSSINNIKVIVATDIKEQERIADFLTAIDRKIEALSRQIEQTEQFKKGLLQKLFV